MENENNQSGHSNLTLAVLKKKIPTHCWEKSLTKSMYYMVRDLLLISTCLFTYDYFSTTWQPGKRTRQRMETGLPGRAGRFYKIEIISTRPPSGADEIPA